MAATRQDVDRWKVSAKSNGYAFVISVCDTFDWEDYPVYCKDFDEVIKRYPQYCRNMQQVNEVIDIVNNIEDLRLINGVLR